MLSIWSLVVLIQGYCGLIFPLILFGYLSYHYPEYIFPPRQQRQQDEQQRQKYQPTPKYLIDSIHEIKYHEGMFNLADNVCAICLSGYEIDVAVRVLPCQHHYHSECAVEWLR